QLDPEASTSLDPWSGLEMEITVGDDSLALVRHFKAGPREATETLALTHKPVAQEITVEGWWDNRHIDAWLANSNRITVTPRWNDAGDSLVLTIAMVLETQQGDRAVGVTRTFTLEDDGRTLREVQVRESRKRPVIHVYRKP
ncbi:MAG: hypothetical protein ACO3DQ_01240, partial [Cephaloticoccus sp.]